MSHLRSKTPLTAYVDGQLRSNVDSDPINLQFHPPKPTISLSLPIPSSGILPTTRVATTLPRLAGAQSGALPLRPEPSRGRCEGGGRGQRAVFQKLWSAARPLLRCAWDRTSLNSAARRLARLARGRPCSFSTSSHSHARHRRSAASARRLRPDAAGRATARRETPEPRAAWSLACP